MKEPRFPQRNMLRKKGKLSRDEVLAKILDKPRQDSQLRKQQQQVVSLVSKRLNRAEKLLGGMGLELNSEPWLTRQILRASEAEMSSWEDAASRKTSRGR